MVGLGEAYLPAFVLAAGLGDLAAGLIATLPMLAGAVFQLVTPAAVARLGSYRRWVVVCASVQAASFLPLVIAAVIGRIGPVEVFVTAAVYWGFGMATGPAWNTWIGTLVPAPMRAQFFALRSRLCQAAVAVGLAAAGIILHYGAGRVRPMLAFGVLFALAAAARLASSRFLAAHGEPRPASEFHAGRSPFRFFRRLEGGGHRLLLYMLYLQASVQIAAPFFTPYMLGPLNLSYGHYTTLIATSFVARIVALPALGKLAQSAGPGRLLRVGGLGIIPLPALWLLSHSFSYLVMLQIASGVAWAAYELATLLAFFEGIHERERTGVLTLFNLANAVAIVSGSLVAAAIFKLLGSTPSVYPVLFMVSALARVGGIWLLRRVPAMAVPVEPVALRTLAVRPSAGAIDRPILPALSETGE